MTEKTKLIRGILDAATSDNLAEAERLIDEYTENEVVGFEIWLGMDKEVEPGIRKHFHEYIKETHP